MSKETESSRPEWQFQPGVSGNPGGRPKGWKQFREACRGHTDEALETLVSLMRCEKEDGRVRLAAACALLDRGWGRPTQPVGFDDDTGRPDDGVAMALMKVILGALPVETLPGTAEDDDEEQLH